MRRRYGRSAALVSPGGRCVECRPVSAGGNTGHADRINRSTNGTLQITGPVGGLSTPIQKNNSTKKKDPSIFAIALETLAVKAFGDMSPNARLRLIRDRFVAGHENCALRWHLDSVPPETPIRDIVDRCRVCESHADNRTSADTGTPADTHIVRDFAGMLTVRSASPDADTTAPDWDCGNGDLVTAPTSRDWTTIVWQIGLQVGRCPELDETFPYMLPGWWAAIT